MGLVSKLNLQCRPTLTNYNLNSLSNFSTFYIDIFSLPYKYTKQSGIIDSCRLFWSVLFLFTLAEFVSPFCQFNRSGLFHAVSKSNIRSCRDEVEEEEEEEECVWKIGSWKCVSGSNDRMPSWVVISGIVDFDILDTNKHTEDLNALDLCFNLRFSSFIRVLPNIISSNRFDPPKEASSYSNCYLHLLLVRRNRETSSQYWIQFHVFENLA